MMHRYVLNGHTAILERSLKKWAEWMETGDCSVCLTTIGGSQISTVFLGATFRWSNGLPLLFETMIFTDGEVEPFQWRYATWEEAETDHARIVKLVERRLAGEKVLDPVTGEE